MKNAKMWTLAGAAVAIGALAAYAWVIQGEDARAPVFEAAVSEAPAPAEIPPAPEASEGASVAEPTQEELQNWDPKKEPAARPFHTGPDGTQYFALPVKKVRDGKIYKVTALGVVRPLDPHEDGVIVGDLGSTQVGPMVPVEEAGKRPPYPTPPPPASEKPPQ